MVRRIYLVVLVMSTLLASGCSTTLKASKLDESGRFPSGAALVNGAVKVNKPFQDKFKPLLFVKMDDSKANQFKDFYVESFKNMKLFGSVQEKAQLEQMVLERKLSDKVSNVSDLIGLNNLSKQIGPFLVAEPYVEWKGGYDYVASLKAIDPETGETVFHVEQKAFNWAGLDKPLFYPLFNAFLDWGNNRPIETRKAPVKKKKRNSGV